MPPGKRTWAAGAGVLAVAIVALAVVAAREDERPLRLVVAAVRQPATSLFFVAQASGCLRAQRLEVDERSFELGRDALTLLLGGGADVAVAYETPVLARFLTDERLRVLSMLHTSTRNTRVVARRDRGVEDVADLRGKRLGAARGTNADFFVENLLAFGGVPRSEVTIVDLAPEDAPGALASGRVDAAALSDPYAAWARAGLGPDGVEIQTDLYSEFSLVVTRSDAAPPREALVAFLRALACAERFTREHPAEAFAAVRARFPEQGERELAAQLERVTRGIGLDEVLSMVLRRELEWLVAARRARGAPDLSALVDPSVLDEVEPEAVNLVIRR